MRRRLAQLRCVEQGARRRTTTPPLPNDAQSWQVALQSKQKDALQPTLDAAFPASDVLLYGVFFGLLSAVLVIPLVMAWRGRSKQLIVDTYPRPVDDPGASLHTEARSRLEADLNLNTTVLHNPVTVLTVLTPRVTAALAAFLPQLGK